MRHDIQLVQIEHMHPVDLSLDVFILAYSGRNLLIEYRVGKAHLVFITHSAQAVGRSLMNKI